MPCERCGANTDPEQTVCSNCQAEPKVTVLPPEARENFNGLTIEQNGPQFHESQSDSNRFGPHIYVRHFGFGSAKNGLFTKLLLGAVLLLVFMIALPLALILLAFIIIRWLLFKHPSH